MEKMAKDKGSVAPFHSDNQLLYHKCSNVNPSFMRHTYFLGQPFIYSN